MLRINPHPTFVAKVKISIPGAETPAVLDVTYRHKGVAALADWWQQAAPRPLGEALAEIIVDLVGLHDLAGQPLAYSDAALLQLLDGYHGAGQELLGAYFSELTKARAKN